MLDRIARIVRAEIGALERAVRRRWPGAADGPEERFDPPPPEPVPGDRAKRRSDAPGDVVRRAFAALEIPLTAGRDEIRHAYRRLMSRYHPDHHAGDADRQGVATELSRRLTEAYRTALDWVDGRRNPPDGRSGSGP
jgi:DnaJ-domain-containing protein 1